MKRRILILNVALLLLCSSYSYGADIYWCDDNGAETTWGNCEDDSPMSGAAACTVPTAMSNAVAGDTVNFRGGTYDVAAILGGDCTYVFESARFKPTNQGTNGNPIIFKAYTAETPVFDDTLAGGETRCVIIGSYNKDYITWDGFTLQSNGGTKMGGAMVYGATPANTSVGCEFKNLTINGGSDGFSSGTQYDGIRIEDTTDTLVQNCTIYNFQGNDSNTSALKLYHNFDLIVENCEIYDSRVGIYDKSETVDCIYRYNYIHDCYQNIRLTPNFGQLRSQWYHNVIAKATQKDWFSGSTYGDHDDFVIYNNTIYGTTEDVIFNIGPGSGFDVYNNIIYPESGTTPVSVFRGHNNTTYDTFDHNQWGDNFFNITVNYGGGGRTFTSLATWQASGELVGGGDPGSLSLASDPLFTNGGGSMDLLTDFALENDSPCSGTGRGGINMGADIDEVGPGGEAPATTTSSTTTVVSTTTTTATPSYPNFSLTGGAASGGSMK